MTDIHLDQNLPHQPLLLASRRLPFCIRRDCNDSSTMGLCIKRDCNDSSAICLWIRRDCNASLTFAMLRRSMMASRFSQKKSFEQWGC